MAKVSIDGLLGLNLEEIEIVYRRCRGETVEKIAKDKDIPESTFYRSKMPVILEMLEVENWREFEKELCIPLRRIIPSLSALKAGWPDAFREKIEELREPVEFPKQPAKSDEPQSSQQQSSEEQQTTAQPVPPTDLQPTAVPSTRISPIWIYVAIPLLILALFCIAGLGAFSRFIAPMILTPRPTQTVAVSTQQHTATLRSTDTTVVTASQTSSPTITTTPTDTLTPRPTLTFTATPTFFIKDNFDDGISEVWKNPVYGDVPLVVGDSKALKFLSKTKYIFGDSTWGDYEVRLTIDNTSCQGQVESNTFVIGLRYQDSGNMVAFRWGDWRNDCQPVWLRGMEDTWEILSQNMFSIPQANPNSEFGHGRTLRVSVKGEDFTTSYGGGISIPDVPATGAVVLIADPNAIIDNFEILSLNP